MVSAWAQEEMGGADFGDKRLDKRAAVVLSALGDRPQLSIPAACGGHAEMHAAYRFFANQKVTFEQTLAPHVERTLQRMAEQGVVLLVQDTTEIDLTRPAQQVAGVGELDRARRGVLVHPLHAFTPQGVPLGTVWAECLNRPEGVWRAPASEKRRRRQQKPIEQKESMRWIQGLRRAREVAGELPQVHCICLADSEADLYEWFAEPRGESPGRVDWLVRAAHDRLVQTAPDRPPEHLREQLLATPALYQATLPIRRRQAKVGRERRGRRRDRRCRLAQVEVRAMTVTLRPPPRPDRTLPPITVNVVQVHEPHPPAEEPAVEWLLVTTLPIDTPEQVRQIVEYYCVRWSIEILFRTLKSGCRIERRRFEHVERIWPCLGLFLIVAWRTLFACRTGRACPEANCEMVFAPAEWKATWTATHSRRLPRKPPRLREMVHLVARLGGYVERPASEPGPQTVWIGLQRMYDLAWAWQSFGPEVRIRGP